jgi:hypothetical protein
MSVQIPLRRSYDDETVIALIDPEPGRLLCTWSVGLAGLDPAMGRYFVTPEGTLIGTWDIPAEEGDLLGTINALFEPVREPGGRPPRYRIRYGYLADPGEVISAWFASPRNGPMPADVAALLGLPIGPPPSPARPPQATGTAGPANSPRLPKTQPSRSAAEWRITQAIGKAQVALERGKEVNVAEIARDCGVERTKLYRNAAFKALLDAERGDREVRRDRFR